MIEFVLDRRAQFFFILFCTGLLQLATKPGQSLVALLAFGLILYDFSGRSVFHVQMRMIYCHASAYAIARDLSL